MAALSRAAVCDVQVFGTCAVKRENHHPDESVLLDLVAGGRLPFIREAASHAGRCRLCARTVTELLAIAATMFESEPSDEMSARSRRDAIRAARSRAA
jgi:hypothetical protein